VLARVGARPGGIFGRYSNTAFYQALLDHRFDVFDRLVDELCDELGANGIQVLISNAAEGHNPALDVCRLLAGVAVHRLRSRALCVSGFDFPLMERPSSCPVELRPSAVWMELGPNTVGRKLAAARNYPELSAEVDAAIREHGLSTFAVECLRPAVGWASGGLTEGAIIPAYELHGQRRVRDGRYQQVIRYRDHIAPLARYLSHQVAEAAA